MAFLRTKKINGNDYCYLVQNKHTKKGPRQKVKKYLGRAFKFEQKKELDFFEFFKVDDLKDYLKKNTREEQSSSVSRKSSISVKKEILQDLIKLELVRHGFKEKSGFLVNKKISFDGNKILKKEKEVLLSLNEGFLCSFTIDRIIKFKKSGDFQKDALKLAKYFVEAGINVPQEVFVGFYEKC